MLGAKMKGLDRYCHGIEVHFYFARVPGAGSADDRERQEDGAGIMGISAQYMRPTQRVFAILSK